MKVYACFALLVLAQSSAAGTVAPGTDSPDNGTSKAPIVTSDVTTTNASIVTSDVTTTNTSTVTSDVTTTNASNVTSDVTTTKAPTVTSDVTTTNASNVTSDVTTTKAPTVTSDVTTTKAPTVTSDVTTTNASIVTSDVTTTNTSTVTSDVTTTNASNVTSDVTTPKAPVATTSHTSTPAVRANTSVVISETNLLLGTDDQLFIELQVHGQGNTANTTDSESNILDGLTLVIFNGADGSVFKKYDNSTLTLDPTTGLAIQSVDKTDVQNLTSVAVVLYPQGVDTSKVENAQDFVSYATGNGILVDKLAETILPHGAPLPVVGSHENETMTLSMTRSGKETKDNSAFVLAPATRNQINNATLSPKANATLQLRGNDCKDLVDDTDVRNMLVGKVNKLCQCGMSTLQIVGNVTCQKDHFFNFIINQSYEGQSEHFVASFKKYVNSSSTWLLNGKNYSVVNCTKQCWTSGHHLPPPTDSKSGNIKVTVAVVLSCIVVFLLILVAVIFYMRSKRRGIMRQFRMTRLQEDDDMDDMDNFMGAIDQEPDFSSSRNNLTN